MSSEDYLNYIKDLIKGNSNARYRYLIRIFKQNDPWFFLYVDGFTNIKHTLVWTAHKRNACYFGDEESVEEFKAEWISPRKADIIRLDVATNPAILLR